MNKRGLPFIILGLLVLAAGGLLLTGCSSGDDPLQAPTVSSANIASTPAFGKPINSLHDALNYAREIFIASPPYLVHEIESVFYVDTVAGLARAIFDPAGTTAAWQWLTDADHEYPVWVVVADGRFVLQGTRGSGTPGPSARQVWVVLPQGDVGAAWGSFDGTLDLTSLGIVEEIPGPLAEYPAPIQLE